MTTDDKLNIAILIAALLFFAWVIPATLRTYDDANAWTGVQRGWGK